METRPASLTRWQDAKRSVPRQVPSSAERPRRFLHKSVSGLGAASGDGVTATETCRHGDNKKCVGFFIEFAHHWFGSGSPESEVASAARTSRTGTAGVMHMVGHAAVFRSAE